MSDFLPKIKDFMQSEGVRFLRRDCVAYLKLMSPFFTIVCVVAYYHDFVFGAVSQNVAINGLIIASALYGVFIIVMRMTGAQMDFYVIERFGREATQGVYMPQLLEQPWLKRRYVRHYLGHIAQTGGTLASALQQNAIENELQALSSEYEHKLELPQFIVGFMIAMGLLGTFVGLLKTLTGISGMLDGFGGAGANMDEQVMKLVVQLREPLAGMGTAFSASMFGLVTSLMLAIMMINLRRYISRVVSCARNVMHDLTELSRGASPGGSGWAATQLTPEDIAAIASGGSGGGGGGGGKTGRAPPGSIADGESSLQDLVYQVNDTSLLVANRIDSLTQKIDALLQVFESSVKLTQKQTDLLSAVPRISDSSEKLLREIRGMAGEQIEQKKFFQLLIDVGSNMASAQNELLQTVPGINETGTRIIKELKGIAGGQSEQHKLSQTLVDASHTIARAQGDLLRTIPAFGEVGEKIINEISGIFGGPSEQHKISQTFVEANKNATRAINGIIETQRETHADLTISLRDLDDRLARIEENTNAFGGHLGDVKESFTKIGSYSGVAEAISTGIGHQTLLLETLVKEDRNLQKRLTSIQQDLRERFQTVEGENDDVVVPPV